MGTTPIQVSPGTRTAAPLSVELSLANTRELLAVAVGAPAPPGATNAALGVDVEPARRADAARASRLARRWFAPAEAAELDALAGDAEALERRFVHLWTAKEAYVKALGKGIAGAPLSTFEVHLAEQQRAAAAPAGALDVQLRDPERRCGGAGGALRLLSPDGGEHVVALCVLGAGPAPEVRAFRTVPLGRRTPLALEEAALGGGSW